MQKENIPKFFTFYIINIILTVIPFIAVMLILNTIKYCINVKKFYKKYEELYNNN